MPNRLAGETSPYLLQHAQNPVDWYPWGNEPFARAKAEDKPVLVSIGYSACHWCHVMAHESFEDASTAQLMNQHLICIKVDREERPDIDSVYMEAIQALTGQGGWPLNIFLTPEGKPFFGGTYFPPEQGRGMPSWGDVVDGVATAYRARKSDVAGNAGILTRHIRDAQEGIASKEVLTTELLRSAFDATMRQVDEVHGGFGGAPKFPQPLGLEFLLRMSHRFHDGRARDFALASLRTMAGGGIFDQVGGGFHRYSVDQHWLVPHFEKMLYDNALLTRVYLHVYQISGELRFREIAEQTLDYMARDLLSVDGGFYSSEDADSEGIEGKFYVWSPDELSSALPEEAARGAARLYEVTPGGNFEGKTILTRSGAPLRGDHDANPVSQELESEIRERLLTVRSRRVRPGKDTKILVSWNALAIRAFAEAGRILNRPDYLAIARRAAKFILDSMRPNGRLVRSYRNGPGPTAAFLEDYAYMIEALTVLYETTREIAFLDEAESLVAVMIRLFGNEETDPFFDGEHDDLLVVRPRTAYDNPIPSGNSAAAMALLRLAAITGEERYTTFALPAFAAARQLLDRAPLAVSYLLSALDFYLASPLQVAIVGTELTELENLEHEFFSRYLPDGVLASGQGDRPSLLRDRHPVDDRATAYVCHDFHCDLPASSPAELAAQLDGDARRTRES
ncbi:MAG: thioredoxin domain-containing protein [Chloroflexota bacterium]